MTQIRGVFPLPQTGPLITGTVQKVCLPSGGVYVIPPGNYLVSCGPNTLLQWFDPIEMTWRTTVASQDFTGVTSDGTNYRLWNPTGAVMSVAVGAAGATGTDGIGPIETETQLSFDAAPAGGVTADGFVVIGGSVPAPTVVQAGKNFEMPPLVACDPPPVGGVQATFVATLDGTGGLAGVTQVDPGAGYKAMPNFYVIPQPRHYQGMPRFPHGHAVRWPAPGLIHPLNVWPGSVFQENISAKDGVMLQSNALTGSGTLTAVKLGCNGTLYAAAPDITIAGGPLAGADATATLGAAAANDTSYLQALVNG